MKAFLFTLVVVILIGLGITGFAVRHLFSNQQVEKSIINNLKRSDIKITLIEGKRKEEIALLLEANGVCSASSFLTAAAGVEGKLFPDTYQFFPDTSAREVVKTLTDNFEVKTKTNPPSNDELILASIIEREAKNDTERSTIAGVYTNRLNKGIKLDADPTVQYAKDSLEFKSQTIGQSQFTFWKSITQAEYQSVKSEYNTYLKPGLPPTPITNPGLASILAAQNPAQHSYLYFLHKNNQLLLSKTLAEHLSKQ